jgi:prepilin-type N-terminal cleavage/methylation domain-containing protein
MKKNQPNKAFSLIEISVVLLIIGILIAGVSSGIDLYQDFKVTTAKSLTQNSRVSRINGLALWLESSQKSSFEPDNITNGTAITKWKNIAPNLTPNDRARFDAVKTSSSVSGPIYRENAINSLAGLEFVNSENRCMQVASGFDGLGIDSTVFLVAGTLNSWVPSQYYVMLSRWPDGNGTSNLAWYEIRGNNSPFSNADNNYSWINYSVNSSKLTLFNLIINRSSNIRFYLNRKISGTVVNTWTGSYSNTLLFIGCKGGWTTLSPNANFSEIIVYDRVLSDNERIDVENYLSQKWGKF